MIETLVQNKTFSLLQEDHLSSLEVSKHVQQGLKHNIDLNRIWEYVLWYWNSTLKAHFEIEEQIFQHIPAENELLKKTQTQHRRIKRLFETASRDIKTLNHIEEELERLIRFEEHHLYNDLIEIIPLKNIQISYKHKASSLWKDPFWL